MVLLTSNNRPVAAPPHDATHSGSEPVPALVRNAGPEAVERYLAFFAELTRTRPKRVVYRYRSVVPRFLAWCEDGGVALAAVRPDHVPAFLEAMTGRWTPTTANQYATNLRNLLRWLAADGVLAPPPSAPAAPTPPPARPPAGDGLAELKQFLFDLDRITEGSRSYRPGLVAMYPVVVGGMDLHAIAAATGIPLGEVETYAGRLRANRIWRPDGRIAVDFKDPEEDPALTAVNLVLIIGCAAGVFRRFPHEEPPAAG